MFMLARRIVMFFTILLAVAGLAVTPNGSPAKADGILTAAVPTPGRDQPKFSAYKGVSIGMSLDDVREKLGKPKETSDTMDFYAPSDNEFIQIYYEAKKVTALTVTFSGKLDAAPDAKSVFGETVEVKPDGGIFKMVHYPKAGFWISYNKISGDDPMIMIAIKKI
jgi:hypothetical protein